MRLVLKHRQNTFSFKSTTLTTSHPIHGHTDCPQFKKKKKKKERKKVQFPKSELFELNISLMFSRPSVTFSTKIPVKSIS